MAKFEIETGIPLPSKWVKTYVCPYPFEEMLPGQSFCVPLKKDQRLEGLQTCVTQYARRLGYRVKTRKIEGNAIRVWMVGKLDDVEE